jgi:hypothetical protein
LEEMEKWRNREVVDIWRTRLVVRNRVVLRLLIDVDGWREAGAGRD